MKMEMHVIIATPDVPVQSQGDHSWMYKDEAVAALHECDLEDCIVCAELERRGIKPCRREAPADTE